MRIHRIISNTKSEGPGVRFCVYVQGCSNHCKGCFAKHLWPYSGGVNIFIQDLLSQFYEVRNMVDGLTLLGGEPFDQAEELWQLAQMAKSFNKNVITFTGYKYEELLNKGGSTQKLLDYTDLLCDGPFEKGLVDYSRPMLGSANQRYIFLTNVINQRNLDCYQNSFEIRIDSNGRANINGMGNIDKLKKYIKKRKDWNGCTIV